MTFTCAYGTFMYGTMSFDLYNAPTTFRRCMLTIISEYVENTTEWMTSWSREPHFISIWKI